MVMVMVMHRHRHRHRQTPGYVHTTAIFVFHF
jgi:hypothetical protein